MGLLPDWVYHFKWSDFFGGVKEDIGEATKHVGTGVKSILKGATGILTPSIIWVVVIAIIGLVIFKKYKKVIGL